MLQTYVDNGVVPGLISLVSRGDETHLEIHGRMAYDGPELERDGLFRVSSFTKPITAAATMLLVDELRLSLDAPVADVLPELANPVVLRDPAGPIDDTVPAERAITARDLLTFRLGLGESDNPGLREREAELELHTFGPPLPRTPLKPDEWMRRFGTMPLQYQPGERWLYATGSHLLGVLISRVAGQPLEEFLHERVFEPLGMRDTGFTAADPARLTTAYVGGGRTRSGRGESVADCACFSGRRRRPDLDRGRLPRVYQDAARRRPPVACSRRGADDRPPHPATASGGRRLPRAGHRLGLRPVRQPGPVRLGRRARHAVVHDL
ncbi:hypothetical protein GCM10009630_41750 [Kribbella jejuensis]|uniref:Beta-lactamase n=1 Tax=Kribbella jejuensis TaxID=236068 RepID=A0A542EQG8_9ACTN|nr:serine hydrolase domain-containing protein [Kribbella jejuensis]TQJ17602.1 beta-lactamase [Kribbella jejuensis]